VLVVLTIASVFLWAHQAVAIIEEEIGGEAVATVAPPEIQNSGTAAPQPTVPLPPEPPPPSPLEREQTTAIIPAPRPDSPPASPSKKKRNSDGPAKTSATAPVTEAEQTAARLLSPSIGLAAPRCEGIYVYIVSAFDDPAHSVATLTTRPKKAGKRVWVGQMFGEYRVLKIDYNPRYFSSAVWLEADSTVCQVLLRDDHPVRERYSAKAAKRNAKAAKKAQARARKKQKRARKRRLRNKKRRKKSRKRR